MRLAIFFIFPCIAGAQMDGSHRRSGRSRSGGISGRLREDLGDARSFALDTPKSRAPRIEKLRALAQR